MLTLNPKILHKNGRKLFAVLPYNQFLILQERLSDANDLLALHKEKYTQGKKRSVSLSEAKRILYRS